MSSVDMGTATTNQFNAFRDRAVASSVPLDRITISPYVLVSYGRMARRHLTKAILRDLDRRGEYSAFLRASLTIDPASAEFRAWEAHVMEEAARVAVAIEGIMRSAREARRQVTPGEGA